MELHLHLSAAFRALDRKWGPTIELDTSNESLSLPCLPAVIDRPATTFSSEEFLRRRHRPKPYSRGEERRRKQNVKTNDSFADISSSRISLKEVEATSMDSGLDEDCAVTKLVEDEVRSVKKTKCIVEDVIGSATSLDSVSKEKIPRPVKIFKQLKSSARSYIDKTSRKKVKC